MVAYYFERHKTKKKQATNQTIK